MKAIAGRWMGLGLVVIGGAAVASAEAQGGNRENPRRPGRGEQPTREEHLARFDQDGDGQLDKEERAAVRESMRNRKGPGGPRGERPSRQEILKRFDQDGDGQLSEPERAALRKHMRNRQNGPVDPRMRREMVERFDVDSDGKLDEDERDAMRAALEERRRERERPQKRQ